MGSAAEQTIGADDEIVEAAAAAAVVAGAAAAAVVASDHYRDGNAATVVAKPEPEQELGFLESSEDKYFEIETAVKPVSEAQQPTH